MPRCCSPAARARPSSATPTSPCPAGPRRTPRASSTPGTSYRCTSRARPTSPRGPTRCARRSGGRASPSGCTWCGRASGSSSTGDAASGLPAYVHLVGLVDEVGTALPVPDQPGQQRGHQVADVRRPVALLRCTEQVTRGPKGFSYLQVLTAQPFDAVREAGGGHEDLVVQAGLGLGDVDVRLEVRGQVREALPHLGRPLLEPTGRGASKRLLHLDDGVPQLRPSPDDRAEGLLARRADIVACHAHVGTLADGCPLWDGAGCEMGRGHRRRALCRGGRATSGSGHQEGPPWRPTAACGMRGRCSFPGGGRRPSVGRLTVVDVDVVEASNLNRQILHDETRIGHGKAESARVTLERVNPHVRVVPWRMFIDESTVDDLVGDADVIVDCMDNFPARYVLNDCAIRKRVPFVFGSIWGLHGQLSVFQVPDTPCLRCVFRGAPPRETFPVLGATPGVIGTWQALEALKLLTGVGHPLKGGVLSWDGMESETETFRVVPDPECSSCSEVRRELR